eukprot:5656148-Karenia_brevis.AAC.1
MAITHSPAPIRKDRYTSAILYASHPSHQAPGGAGPGAVAARRALRVFLVCQDALRFFVSATRR